MPARTESEIRAEFQQQELLDAARSFDLFGLSRESLRGTRVCEARIGNGTRVVVAAATLGDDATVAVGGRVLVSTLYPWQRVHALAEHGDLHWAYLMEKFGQPGRVFNWGDMYGIARSIAIVTGRPLVGVPGMEDERG